MRRRKGNLNLELPITGVFDCMVCSIIPYLMMKNKTTHEIFHKVCETFSNGGITEQQVDNWWLTFLRRRRDIQVSHLVSPKIGLIELAHHQKIVISVWEVFRKTRVTVSIVNKFFRKFWNSCVCACARVCIRTYVLTQCANSGHCACSTHAKCGLLAKSGHTRGPLLVLASDSDSSSFKTQESTIKLWGEPESALGIEIISWTCL